MGKFDSIKQEKCIPIVAGFVAARINNISQDFQYKLPMASGGGV